MADDGDEAYELTVFRDGLSAVAAGVAGLRWAVQAYRQLLPPAIVSRTVQRPSVWPAPCVHIADRPRYPWRGVMLDVARWYEPVESLYTRWSIWPPYTG
jgi:hexosaminidase